MALTLRREQAAKLASSVAAGWLTRAERLLNDEPESSSHAYLAIAHAELAWNGGEFEHALTHVDRALEIAERSGDRDVLAWAVMRRGEILVSMGRLDEGWSLMEEISAAAVGGELGGYTTGAVFCNVVEMCRNMADYARAREWSDAAKRWCERQSIAGFPGVCRIRRGEVMRLMGAWGEAEREVERATVELRDFHPAFAGAAFHELGEVRLRMGEMAAAEEAFHQAHELGEDPQPGLALLRLGEGKVEAAAASIARSLEELTWDKLARARLLPAQAEIARASADTATAREAADELDAIAAEYDTTTIRAGAEWAHGLADLAAGDPTQAVRRLRSARRLWQEVDSPYEAAMAGAVLAEAHLAEGDRDAATMELRSAHTAFQRLGAATDTRRVDELLARTAEAAPAARARRTFVFTDIVGSTTLLEAIGDDAWSDLRRWHDEMLRGCVGRHSGEEVDHTGDGFFVAFDDAASAVACAREIQRQLAEHRRSHGFAPLVRIGLHAAEATQQGPSYSGKGVHTAARIGALAGGGEIIASASSIDGLDGLEVTERRMVDLKGIAEPVEVVSVGWA
ncbi:MAG: LuxR family transcriptional regulator [Actinobacteria bacterium]|nr:LuxR family transcriptional regulator [Actinomycetota bacterium]